MLKMNSIHSNKILVTYIALLSLLISLMPLLNKY